MMTVITKPIRKINRVTLWCGQLFTAALFLICLSTQAANAPRLIIDVFNEALAIKSSDHKKSQELLFQLFNRSDELNEEQRLELVYLNGYLHTMRGSYYRALEIHSNLTMVGRKDLALRAYTNMLAIQMLNRDYGRAAKYLPNMMTIINDKKLTLPSGFIYNALLSIGFLYKQLGDYDSSLSYLMQLPLNDLTLRQQCFSQIHLSEVNINLRLINLDAASIADTLQLCKSINEIAIIHTYLADLAYIYIERQQYQGAIDLLLTELANVERLDSAMSSSEFNSYLAYSYQQLELFSLAKQYAEQALLTAKDLAQPQPRKLAYEVLYQQALLLENKKTAVELLHLYIKANDDYLKVEHNKALGLEQAHQHLASIEEQVKLFEDQVYKNTSIEEVQQLGNDAYMVYFIIERILQLGFVLFIGYQIFSVIKVLKQIKRQRRKLVFDTTTAYTRPQFFKLAEKMLNDSKSNNIAVSLILFNIDNLRHINEFHNNDRGDWLLKNAVQACIKIKPESSVFGRLGSDEFAVLITNYNVAQGETLADDFRLAIQQLDTTQVSYRFNSHASFGVTDNKASGYKLSQLIFDADLAMQKSKQAGGNQVNTLTACSDSNSLSSELPAELNKV